MRMLIMPDTVEAREVHSLLTADPDWSNPVPHVCPLCGFESNVTNIHRNCSKAPHDRYQPFGARADIPMFVKSQKEFIVKSQAK